MWSQSSLFDSSNHPTSSERRLVIFKPLRYTTVSRYDATVLPTSLEVRNKQVYLRRNQTRLTCSRKKKICFWCFITNQSGPVWSWTVHSPVGGCSRTVSLLSSPAVIQYFCISALKKRMHMNPVLVFVFVMSYYEVFTVVYAAEWEDDFNERPLKMKVSAAADRKQLQSPLLTFQKLNWKSIFIKVFGSTSESPRLSLRLC